MFVGGELRAGSVESLTLSKRLRFYEVDVAVLEGHYVEEAGVWIVRGREPIRSAIDAGTDIRAFLGWNFTGHEGATGGINSCRPVQFLYKRRRPQKLSIGSIEDIEETVAVGLEKQLARYAVFLFVHQHRSLIGVVVV